MLIICIHGAPGVGKLSVGRELADATGFVLIHDHLVIETAAVVFAFGEPRFSALRSKLFADLLDAACSSGRGIVLTHANDIFWQPRFAVILQECASRYGYEVRRVFLTCAPHEHTRRIADPARARYRKINDMDRLRRLTELGEFQSIAPHMRDILIDTTSHSPSRVAEEIASSLNLLQEAQVRAG
jgi:shikimate kinase